MAKRKKPSKEKKRKKRKKEKKRKRHKKSKKSSRRRRESSSSSSSISSSSSSSSHSSSSSGEDEPNSFPVNTGTENRESKIHSSLTSKERKKFRKQAAQARKELFMGYTNRDNPFGDPNLHSAFVWRKKLSAEATTTGKISKRDIEENRDKLIEEVKKVQSRRKAREVEREERQQLRELDMRLRDADQYEDWERKEDAFHDDQEKKRTVIHIKEGRQKVVDKLARNYLMYTKLEERKKYGEKYTYDKTELDILDLSVEIEEPYIVVEKLGQDNNLIELKELQKDIQTFVAIAKRSENYAVGKVHSSETYWKSLAIICSCQLSIVRDSNNIIVSKNLLGETEVEDIPRLRPTVQKEIDKMLNGKRLSELLEIEKDIQNNLKKASTGHRMVIGSSGKTEVVNLEYWESLCQQLRVYKARASLRNMHGVMLLRRLSILEDHLDKLQRKLGKQAIEQQSKNMKNSKQQSSNSTMPPPRPVLKNDDTSVQLYNSDTSKGMESDEDLLGDDVSLPKRLYTWADKYRPRKPRFFNRVKSGYDWNIYNATHYDLNTPPPKQVHGYRFQIFYPDLIDKTETPTYFVEPCAGTDKCAILRFHAGPPYEDVAFKIENQRWMRQARMGYRCKFQYGVLILNFNFRKFFYRA